MPDPRPKILPPLDPGFRPAELERGAYEEAVRRSPRADRLVLGLERGGGLLARHEMRILPPEGEGRGRTLREVERTVKFLLWSRGGWRIWVGGPREVGLAIREAYAPGGERGFDAELMSRAYERSFEVRAVTPEQVPPERGVEIEAGGHLDGYRIGFDLGASDIKAAAVVEGEAVWSGEFPWNPKDEPDPRYHHGHLQAAIERAAEHLPRVEAIGGSSAGVILEKGPRVASLFR
jgi:hypothetical protein